MQYQDHHQAEDDHLELAGGTEQLRQDVLQPLLEQRDDTGPEQRSPNLSRAADDRHEQVLNADLQAERGGIHETLQVGIQPAGGASVQRGQDEDHHTCPRRVDTHGLGHHDAALERPDGPAFARIEKVLGGEQGDQNEGPDQIVVVPVVPEFEAEHLDRRQIGQPAVTTEKFQITEQEVKADAPGDGPERQVVAGELQAQGAQRNSHDGREGQADQQCRPRGAPQDGQPSRQLCCGQPCRRVGAEANESRLSE
jgi:hypothetical protein